MFFPPASFGVVEDGLYRSGIPQPINYEFLKTLDLKTVLILSPHEADASLIKFFENNSSEVHIIGKSANGEVSNSLKTEDLVTDALKIITDVSNYPILVLCKTGKELTGVTIACLRKLQKWSYISIFEEYRRYAIGSRIQPQHEEFIEIYDSERIGATSTFPSFLQKYRLSPEIR